MPYINSIAREPLKPAIADLSEKIMSPGELNYVITTLIRRYLSPLDCRRYADYNEVIGVLECAKQEMYRTLIAEYEDIKRLENGDVW